MPKISVIVPVYNVEPFIHRCVDSILEQTFTDYELILVDDGSPDKCGAICDEYARKDNRIVVIHKENGGLSDARNAGIDWAFANSDSEWITFIDSDDWVHPQYFEILYYESEKNGVRITSCGFLYVSDEDALEIGNYSDYSVIVNDPLFLCDLNYPYEKFNNVSAWGRFYKRVLFESVRFPFGRYHEDNYVIYKLIFSCQRIAVIPDVALYYYNIDNNTSISRTRLSPKRMDDLLEAISQRIDYFFQNKYIRLFEKHYICYCNYITTYSIGYGGQDEFAEVINKHRRRAKQNRKEYKSFISRDVKKECNLVDFKKDSFLNDRKTIRNERGIMISALWTVKNFYRYMRKPY